MSSPSPTRQWVLTSLSLTPSFIYSGGSKRLERRRHYSHHLLFVPGATASSGQLKRNPVWNPVRILQIFAVVGRLSLWYIFFNSSGLNLNIIIIVISGDFKHSRTSFVNAFRSNIRCKDSVASLSIHYRRCEGIIQPKSSPFYCDMSDVKPPWVDCSPYDMSVLSVLPVMLFTVAKFRYMFLMLLSIRLFQYKSSQILSTRFWCHFSTFFA